MDEIIISKEELDTLSKDDLILITYPGRMGDTDGCSFTIKKDNSIIIYRINGIYSYEKSLFKRFPKWQEALQNYNKHIESDKYHIVYMGMGNLLGIDKSIYNELNTIMIEKEKEEPTNLDYELHLGMTYYTHWRKVIKDMYKERTK